MKKPVVSIAIPDEGRRMLRVLARSADPFVEELSTKLNGSVPSLAKHELLEQLKQSPILSDEPHLALLVETLINMAGSAYTSQVPLEPLISGALENLREEADDDPLSDLEEIKLSRRLVNLLSTRCIDLISRGTILRGAHDSVFRSARIFSDLRPLFLDEADAQSIAAALVTHSLAIKFKRSNKNEALFLSLDSDDLLELKQTVERAIRKDQTLRLFAARSGTAVITPEME